MLLSRVMASRWKIEELHPALSRLIQRVEAERQQVSGADRRWGLTKTELAMAAGMHPRTYHRYLRGANLPVDEKGVERIMSLALAVGMDRHEAESYLPDSLPQPVEPLANGAQVLDELHRINSRLDEILEIIRPFASADGEGSVLDLMHSERSLRKQ